jgi:hypothetical protein
MPQQQSASTLPSSVRKWKTEEVFLALNHSFRRQIIRSLAISMKTALQINAGSGLRRYTSLKQLTLLCEAGIVVQTENAKDRRQPFYALAPGVVVCHGEDYFTVDFGCCMLRFEK